jgi:site-specific DNA-methyltransferase (adenine-specific)
LLLAARQLKDDEKMTVTLWQGDALEYMQSLEPGSINAIITDLPYGTTACAWDSIIPFAPMWQAVKRVLMPRGVFVTTASQPFTSKLVMSNLEWFKYEWIWEKDKATGHLDAERRPLRKHENILVFSENGHQYNPQIKRKPPENIRPQSNGGKHTTVYGEYKDNIPRNIPLNMTYPQSIIKINKANIGEWGLHPTQKPVALYKYLILTYTNPGDTVLDFCFGSGTTAVACVETGRNFVGSESNADYFAIASKRIHDAQLQEPLFTYEKVRNYEQS